MNRECLIGVSHLALHYRRAMVVASLIALTHATAGHAQYSYDPSNPDETNSGFAYFGSAKDERGEFIPDVVVILEIEQFDYVFLTDKTGRFRARLPVEAQPAAVKANCSKPGYELLRVNKRPGPRSAATTLQVDCVLRRSRPEQPV